MDAVVSLARASAYRALQAALVVVGLAVSTVLYFFALAAWRAITVNILKTERYAHVPGPKHKTRDFLLWGDLGEVRDSEPAEAHIRWMEQAKSSVICYRGVFYSPRLWLADPVAMHHILGAANSYDFPKPWGLRRFLATMLGEGVIVAEGDVHRRQRKVIQPAFSISAIRDLTPTFFEHANRCADIIGSLVDACEGPTDKPLLICQSAPSAKISEKGAPVLDVLTMFSRTTLDIIGDAGFSWNFNSWGQDKDNTGSQASEAFKSLMKSTVDARLSQFLMLYLQNLPGFGWVGYIPTERKRNAARLHASMAKAAQSIIDSKRKAITAELGGRKEASRSELEEIAASNKTSAGKDLLHIMMRSNFASDVRESEKLTDEELLASMTTLLLAGHETTSTQLTWLSWTLGKKDNWHVQDKLRAEIQDHFAGRDEIEYDKMMAMPYLDKVCREILRLLSPVVQTSRTVTQEQVIPLGKDYPRADGKGTFNSVLVKKGQDLFIPVAAINKNKEIWGADAEEFNPERWDKVPTAAKSAGFPLQLLTFLEGPRGCVGNRFAIAELKVLVCTLFRQYKFEAIEDWEIEFKQDVVLRSRVKGQKDIGMQMPLRVRRI